MSNYYAPYFYRIDFVVIPSYIELPCYTQLAVNCSFAPKFRKARTITCCILRKVSLKNIFWTKRDCTKLYLWTCFLLKLIFFNFLKQYVKLLLSLIVRYLDTLILACSFLSNNFFVVKCDIHNEKELLYNLLAILSVGSGKNPFFPPKNILKVTPMICDLW